MSSPITQTTPDPPDLPSIDSLLYTITLQCTNYKQSLHMDEQEPLTAEFTYKVNNLQEFFYDRIALLSKNPVLQHHLLWLVSLKLLCSYVIKYKKYVYSQPPMENKHDDSFKQYNSMCGKLIKLCGDYSDLCAHFLNSPDLKLDYFVKGNDQLQDHFCTFISDSLELLVTDHSSDILDHSVIHLEPIQKCLLAYFQKINTLENKHHLMGKAFPMLAQFLRIIYMVGESQLLKPLLEDRIITPLLGEDIVRNCPVNFIDLINFYRYSAFNLLVLSVLNENKINKNYNLEANVYFKVLLAFPNLSTIVYDPFIQQTPKEEKPFPDYFATDQDEDLLVGLLERQEISLNFILNSLLNLNDIRNYIDPNPVFKKELSFLISSLSVSLSKEIHRSASRSGSLHSSTFSFSALKEVELQRRKDEMQNKVINRLRLKSLSAVLLHGSYKEKLNLIVNVMKAFEKHTLNVVLDLDLPLTYEQDNTLYLIGAHSMGKILYLSTIKHVSKLLKLLSIKHLVLNNGINHFPLATLNKICSPHQFNEVLSVKTLLEYDLHVLNGEKIMVFKKGEEQRGTIQDRVQAQLEIASLSEHMKTVLGGY
ncbi:uncharacterized protein CANTADRAFT_88623 [Suhomyces tanzawaensis NRRL Y-17324]|uniref:Uncharacterized protein n=1 Tax=Suhomyces tanzawaensis NRRL Y-17324 TaxID=984487 RepID=A0A1E4SME4_9ASCO|nr:uncharacterized protein CANTADRAFT_88623 [Suhomyces tanzawaensis NRRL Y-17324]ODV80699.1 hypothetical protein CANTADRAFT_88623 [Suhomyces tanzawaensis NRRL Y-17324]